jgi:hypothetical protein
MKIRPVEAELFHAKRIAEGRKDRQTKLIVAFHNLRRGLKRNMYKGGGIVYAGLRITLVD